MKRFIPLVALAFIGVINSGCAEMGGAIVAGLPRAGVEIPPASAIGVIPNGAAILATNTRSEDGLVFAYGTELGVLKPAVTASFEKHLEAFTGRQIQIPLTVLFFDGEGKITGVAQRKFYWNSYDRRTESWMIDDRNSWGTTSIDGGGAEVDGPSVHRVELPRELVNGTLGVQIVNASSLKVLLCTRYGEEHLKWQRGRFAYKAFRSGIIQRNEQILFLVKLVDPSTNRVVAVHPIEVWLPQEGVTAEQWLVTDHGVERR